ncbi:MAG: metalloregulator ArsR/SmtB family transcription factor [Acholeplasmataceae bacterium]|jgi:ArsR family transcriptional regulator|nr:metalloregulator ArsR/SmtB family transcription factor [Acholeplasmataceae bacterium]
MNNNYAQLFKALSDENRLIILEKLIEGQTCGCTLIDSLSISQPTMSYHLNILAQSGLTSTKRDGTWKKHYVNIELIDQLIVYLQNLKNPTHTCHVKE